MKCQISCKPGSVFKTHHFSRLKITLKFKQPTLMTSQRLLFVLSTMSSLLGLALGGVFHALIVTNIAGVLLPHLFTLASLRRFIFCGTIPRVAPTRYYLAPCLLRVRTFLFKKILKRQVICLAYSTY